jgi:hypothetical protein
VSKTYKHHYFEIGPIALKIGSDSGALLEAVRSWLQPFACDKQTQRAQISALLLSCDEDRAVPFKLPKDIPCFFEGPSTRYFSYKGLLVADFPKLGKAVINREQGKFLGLAYTSRLLASPWDLEHFLHPIWELLRQKGVYQYHAGAVCLNERGLLLAGKSGQGKTTLTLDLISRGFLFLADDTCFLRNAETGVEVIGFGEPVRVFPENVSHIKELACLKSGQRNDKISLAVEQHYPEANKKSCSLSGILFPSWVPGEKSRLVALSPAQAALELLPLTMVCFDAGTSRRHFDLNCRLVSELPCAVLKMGKDRERWHPLVLDFIENR